VNDVVVRVTDGRFGYRGQVAVEADLVVERGEVVALVGPNGSGKTTLVKGILGLCERIGGDVELFGGQLRDRGRVGYVPQRQQAAGPIPATVREVVSSGRLACSGLARRLRGSDRQAVDDALAAVGLANRAGSPVATLSGGQQRRALVARALAGRAEVLFLDEPLAGVDRSSRQALAGIVAGLVADGATIVVVLHELGPLAPLITRVARLEAGAIVSDGPPEHVRADDLGHGDEDPHPADEPAPGMGPWP
jgi:zinc transport system ATP-binding protein